MIALFVRDDDNEHIPNWDAGTSFLDASLSLQESQGAISWNTLDWWRAPEKRSCLFDCFHEWYNKWPLYRELHVVVSQDTISGSLHPISPIMHSFYRKDGARNRRWLVGSSPPTCRMKCGICQPCKPVHVAIGSPRGEISETEYYPEVWRCQCGNKLYMPWLPHVQTSFSFAQGTRYFLSFSEFYSSETGIHECLSEGLRLYRTLCEWQCTRRILVYHLYHS